MHTGRRAKLHVFLAWVKVGTVGELMPLFQPVMRHMGAFPTEIDRGIKLKEFLNLLCFICVRLLPAISPTHTHGNVFYINTLEEMCYTHT